MRSLLKAISFLAVGREVGYYLDDSDAVALVAWSGLANAAREGFAAVRLLQEAYSEINVLIAMADKDKQAIAWLLLHGVRGVILHTEVGSLLGKAIRRIQAGEIWAPRSLLESLRNPAENIRIADLAPLSAWTLWH